MASTISGSEVFYTCGYNAFQMVLFFLAWLFHNMRNGFGMPTRNCSTLTTCWNRMWSDIVVLAMTAIMVEGAWMRFRSVADGTQELVCSGMRNMPHYYTNGNTAPQNENKLFWVELSFSRPGSLQSCAMNGKCQSMNGKWDKLVSDEISSIGCILFINSSILPWRWRRHDGGNIRHVWLSAKWSKKKVKCLLGKGDLKCWVVILAKGFNSCERVFARQFLNVLRWSASCTLGMVLRV